MFHAMWQIILIFEQEKEKGGKEKSKMKAVKNFGLLSFGEEAEDDEETIEKVKEIFF